MDRDSESLASGGASGACSPIRGAGGGEPLIFMIGNAHIDPVWLWQWQDGFAEVKATFRAALDRISEFPEFVFTSACAAYYRWIEENAPDMFDEIRQRVGEGRFSFAGGFWIQPDCNIPSGEAFCRHALYSQRYFREKFGRVADVGYNVDSFGHSGMLPQIYKKSGIGSYVFMRPNESEKGMGFDLFNWQSPDGSSVLAFRLPLSYGDWAPSEGFAAEHGDLPPAVAKILETKKIAASAANAAIAGAAGHGAGGGIGACVGSGDGASGSAHATGADAAGGVGSNIGNGDGASSSAHATGAYAAGGVDSSGVAGGGAGAGGTSEAAPARALPMMCFFGVGNHGGGPTISALRAIEAYRAGHIGPAGGDARITGNGQDGGGGPTDDDGQAGRNEQPSHGDSSGEPASGGRPAGREGEVIYASPSAYFDYLRRTGIAGAAPVVKDDLQHHASGCYSANSAIKMLNRKAENRLLTAEKLMSAAHALTGHAYSRALLNRAWEKLMFNQFHDVLAGCSIKAACEDAIELFCESAAIASELSNAALQKLSWNIDTRAGGRQAVRSKESDWMLWERDGAGAPLVAFNPHSFPVEAPICVNKELGAAADRDGAPIPVQLVRGGQTNGADKYNTLFMAKLPPLGYSLFWIYKGGGPGAADALGMADVADAPGVAGATDMSGAADADGAAGSADAACMAGGPGVADAASARAWESAAGEAGDARYILENEHVRLAISAQTGDATEIAVKAQGAAASAGAGAGAGVATGAGAVADTGSGAGTATWESAGAGAAASAEALSAPAYSAVIDETGSDTWAHGIFEFSDEIGRFAHPKVSILENGPLRARIRVEQSWGESLLRQDYSLLAGAKRIDVSVRMDVRMAHRQIKMCFPLAARGAVPVYSMPYGFIEKSADGLEEPSQQWVAAACAGKPAFALINDGKYSFSMKGGALRMVAVRTPGYADHFGERDGQMEYTDQGISEFRYSMLPCCGSYAEIVREARLLNQPPEFVVETYHEGALPASWSGIGISSPNVIAEALKRSEADDGYVLRLFEAAGEPAAGVCVDCPAAGRSFACSFGPQEIKTVLLPDDAAAPVAELLITELGAYGGGEL